MTAIKKIQERTINAAINKLKKARKKIEERWTQGYYIDSGEGGGVCVLGALEYPNHMRAMDDRVVYGKGRYNKDTVALRAIECSIQRTKRYKESSKGSYFVENWNDDSSATKRQVIQAFDRAIKILEKNELC